VAVFSELSVFGSSNYLGFCREQLSEHERRSLICQQARMAAQDVQESLNMLRNETEMPITRRSLDPVNLAIIGENFSSDAALVRGDAVPKVGIGLHYGDCTYGNIGAPLRLDFTVIGPAVNLASRVEGLCSELGADVLATAEFVKYDCDKTEGSKILWKNRGSHATKGFDDPVTVFELDLL
jgi:hypothetical protein